MAGMIKYLQSFRFKGLTVILGVFLAISVVLIGQKQVLFMAIHRNEISKRNTLLGARIDMYFKAYARRAGIPLPNEAKKELKHAG